MQFYRFLTTLPALLNVVLLGPVLSYLAEGLLHPVAARELPPVGLVQESRHVVSPGATLVVHYQCDVILGFGEEVSVVVKGVLQQTQNLFKLLCDPAP